MATITMFIDGQEILAEEGSTVLQAATAAGIRIPTLCHHDALTDWGACRMCLVEVEPRGLLQPACTYPVNPGLRVLTASEKVVKARRFVLQLLFSERNHYCMFCAASGECELQDLAYEYGLDHWLYARPNQRLPVDASRQYFVMDHNRCILCRRCVRACSEVSAVRTLAVGSRGARSLIVADLNQPFGSSSCISCGTCLEVCPTGALIDRKSAYLGIDEQLDRQETLCFGCSVGCRVTVRSRAGRLVRVESDWEAPVNGGLLCRLGRFDPTRVTAARVRLPMRRVNGRLEPCTWEEALSSAAERLTGARTNGGLTVLVSSRATNEELDGLMAAFSRLAGDQGIALYDGRLPPAAPGPLASLADVEHAGVIVALAADLEEEHQVVGCFVRRALDRGARLFVIGGNVGSLADLATMSEEADPRQVAGMVDDAGVTPLVLYGPEATTQVLEAFASIAGTRFLGLPSGTNTMGAAEKGIYAAVQRPSALKYVYAADDDDPQVAGPPADFTIVHACYRSPLVDQADLVLPALHWTEKKGHLTNLEGRVQEVMRCIEPPDGLRQDQEVFAALAEMAGQRVVR